MQCWRICSEGFTGTTDHRPVGPSAKGTFSESFVFDEKESVIESDLAEGCAPKLIVSDIGVLIVDIAISITLK